MTIVPEKGIIMDNSMNATQKPTPPTGRYHAYDGYYRANGKGTGSAVKISLHPAHDDVAGSVFATVAMQRSVGSMQGTMPIYPTFDWQNGICVKLDRADLSQILQVLRGMQESIQEGRGLFHRSNVGTTVIRFSHQIDPNPGYLLSLSRKGVNQVETTNAFYFFDMNEAFTLMLALERSILYVCFGIPEVIPRDTQTTQTASAPVSIPRPVQPVEPVDFRAASGDAF